MAKLPGAFERFKRDYPKAYRAYDQLAAACHEAGPLDQKTRELIKLGMSVGAMLEGATHSHTRRALEAGATPREIRHAVLLAATTLGFPQAIAAFTWVEDILGGRRKAKGKR